MCCSNFLNASGRFVQSQSILGVLCRKVPFFTVFVGFFRLTWSSCIFCGRWLYLVWHHLLFLGSNLSGELERQQTHHVRWYELPLFKNYTNGKKKRCIVKMLITQTICSGWAWKFINMMSLIQTFDYQTFKRFHVRLLRHLYFLWKLLFRSSVADKQQATKLIDAKCKFIELMMRKPLYLC